MKQNTVGKIVLCILLVCFFLNIISSTVFAFDESRTVLINQGESFDVVKIIEQFEDILKFREDNITIDDIENMIVEINYLHEDLYTSLFYPDGELVIESDDECSLILTISSLYLLRGANLVMSLLGDIVQSGNNTPKNALQEIRMAIEFVRKVINVVLVSYNGILTFIQYLSCQQSSEAN